MGKLSFGEITKELGKRWAVLDAEVKEKYKRMAEEEKEKHQKALQAHNN